MSGKAEKMDLLRGAVPLAHFFLTQKVHPGDWALDATCGNGQDTLLLARLAGESGRVWGFDVQPCAIATTRERLEGEGGLACVELIEAGHERLDQFVASGLSAAVFNLGYLPGGCASLVTRPDSTVAALEKASRLLRPGGIVTISVYTGHEGGTEEAEGVEAWCAALPPAEFNVWRSRQLNRSDKAPYLILVEKNFSR